MSVLIDSHLIGRSIKSLRLASHLTQEELADRVGYSVRNLRRIENEGTASIDVVNTFAGLFDVSVMDILNGMFLFCLYIIKKALLAFAIHLLTSYVIHARSHHAESIGATYKLLGWAN